MTVDVFICHSSRDKVFADAACAHLEQRGIRCWIAPRDVEVGKSYAGSINRALKDCRTLLLIFSQHANTSVQVEREVERAVSFGRPVVTLRIEDVMPTEAMEFFLSVPHWLDAYTPPFERHLDGLADRILRLLGGVEPPLPKPQPLPPKAKPNKFITWVQANPIKTIIASILLLPALLFAIALVIGVIDAAKGDKTETVTTVPDAADDVMTPVDATASAADAMPDATPLGQVRQVIIDADAAAKQAEEVAARARVLADTAVAAANKARADPNFSELQGSSTTPGLTYRYAGETVNGKLSGLGVQTWSNGQQHAGEFYGDENNGLVVSRYEDGGRYAGEMAGDKIAGYGIDSFADGDSFAGKFSNGFDLGIYTFHSGRRYKGRWKNNKYEGPGALYAPDGSVIEAGLYANDKLVTSVTLEN